MPEITTDEWKTLKYLEEFLTPFKQFTEIVSGEKYATLSLVHSFIRIILHMLREWKELHLDISDSLNSNNFYIFDYY